MKEREKFGSRLGFILVSAGCAVGLGNVWKFPYMCGQNGGAIFILIYLVFLAALGFPILVCEFAVGRGSQKSCATSFKVLEKPDRKWHHFGYFGIAGNYLLMMFYTMVAGWMICYLFKTAMGEFANITTVADDALLTASIGGIFGKLLESPWELIMWTAIAIVFAFGVCSLGVQKGVERITKIMMSCLIILIIGLVIYALTLPGAVEGVKFYLIPNGQSFIKQGPGNVIFAAMSQAFFTLSIGIGSMAIFGSYLDKDCSLTGSAVSITLLDTFVALMAGLIIIPSCFAFGISPDSGPDLIFVTLPHLFTKMGPIGGRILGTFFFLFMSFAALSTVIAVFENIISFAIDLWGWSRRKAVLINMALMTVLVLPCILGFNVWSVLTPLGPGSGIMDLEDFLVSSNLLPLGALVYLMFCTTKGGWGFDNFLKEANTGKGWKFPKLLRSYMTYILPVIIVVIYLKGYYDLFAPKGLVYLIPWMCVGVLFLCVVAWFAFGNQAFVDKVKGFFKRKK